MNVITEKRKRCLICGHLLERYPNSGEPLISSYVCLNCNNSIILPYRYFISTYHYNSNTMLISNGKIRLIRTNDYIFKLNDIELYLGKNLIFKQNTRLRLTFAFIKGYEEEPNELNIIAQKALKAPNLKSLMVIPTRLMK